MRIILKWWLFAMLAQAAILEISIDGEALLLEADATDVDAKVASIADRLPQLEGSGCSANDGACVRSVVAAALRNAVLFADPNHHRFRSFELEGRTLRLHWPAEEKWPCFTWPDDVGSPHLATHYNMIDGQLVDPEPAHFGWL